MPHNHQAPSFALNAAITGAFLSEGLHDAGYDKMIKAWADARPQGCVEMISEVATYAVIIERCLEKSEEQDFPGVFHYEVTAPFGKWLAQEVITTGNIPDQDNALSALARLMGEFFAQNDPAYTDKVAQPGIIAQTQRAALARLMQVKQGPY